MNLTTLSKFSKIPQKVNFKANHCTECDEAVKTGEETGVDESTVNESIQQVEDHLKNTGILTLKRNPKTGELYTVRRKLSEEEAHQTAAKRVEKNIQEDPLSYLLGKSFKDKRKKEK